MTAMNSTLSTGVILRSVGHCTCVLFSHIWLDSPGRILQQPFQVQAGWTHSQSLALQHAGRSTWYQIKYNTPGGICLQVPKSCCLISCGNWDCEWSERAFQRSPLCPQVPLFVLHFAPAGQECPVQGMRPDLGCWSWVGTGPESERLGLDPAAFAAGCPDWAGLHVCQRCKCCTHLAGSALWRCSHLCCRCAGKNRETVTYIDKLIKFYIQLNFWNETEEATAPR